MAKLCSLFDHLVGLQGVPERLALCLEWVTPLPSDALLGVRSGICQNQPKPLGSPWCCPLDLSESIALALQPPKGQLECEVAVGALLMRLCQSSWCAAPRSAPLPSTAPVLPASALVPLVCPSVAHGGEHDHHRPWQGAFLTQNALRRHMGITSCVSTLHVLLCIYKHLFPKPPPLEFPLPLVKASSQRSALVPPAPRGSASSMVESYP